MISSLQLSGGKGAIWDIVVSDGDIVRLSGTDYIAQKTKQLLLSVRGDYFLNVNHGVPWFDIALGVKNPDIALITSTIINIVKNNQVLSDLGVKAVTVKEAYFDNLTRSLSLNVAVSISGTPGTIEVSI